MEQQTLTVKFVQNAMDKDNGAQYSGGSVRTLPGPVAQRFIGAGVAVEEVEGAEALRQRLEEAERVVDEMKAQVKEAEKAPEPSEVPTIPVPAPHGLEDLTVSQLKDKAKAENVDVSGLNSKADLVSAFGKEKS